MADRVTSPGLTLEKLIEAARKAKPRSDAELVMEMIRRGYAAMKLPKDGGPPEVLRNG